MVGVSATAIMPASAVAALSLCAALLCRALEAVLSTVIQMRQTAATSCRTAVSATVCLRYLLDCSALFAVSTASRMTAGRHTEQL